MAMMRRRLVGRKRHIVFLLFGIALVWGPMGPLFVLFYRLYPTVVIEDGSHFWRQDGALQR